MCIRDRNYTLPPGGGPPVQTPPGAPQPAPVDRQSITNCENSCVRENPSTTDQATCKLNCNAVGTVYAPPPSRVIVGAPPSDADTRAAVIRSSSGVAGSSPPASQPPAKVAQCAAESVQCKTTCATQLEPCNRGCEQGKMSSTDRATCKLTCESTTDLCRDDCRIKEGRCRSTP